MNKTISTVLLHFQEVLASLQVNSQERVSLLGFGSPPKFLLVEQNEFSTDASLPKGKSLGWWKIDLVSIEEFMDDPDTIELEQHGMYYSHGLGDFSIDKDGSLVRIGWQVGPRYGRGYEYTVVQNNDDIQLVNQTLLWVS